MGSKGGTRSKSPLQLGELLSISLSAVETGNDTFRITTKTEIDDLVYSIRQLGLLNPPILRARSSDYIIVSGFRRIAACRSLGYITVIAKILGPDISDKICAQWAIADNALQRPLNLVESSKCLSLLLSVYSDDKGLVEAASSLGLPGNPDALKKIGVICRLPKPVQAGIIADRISLAMAWDLSALEPDTSSAIASLFEDLNIGLNKQRELLLFLKEISLRDNLSIKRLLETKVRKILEDENLDRRQKFQTIRSYLKRQRFPSLVAAEKKFERHLKALNLGDSMKLAAPKDFEGATYSLNLKFTKRSELKQLHQKLAGIIQDPDLKKILNN
jgi:ParB family chromosome partitioning protein